MICPDCGKELKEPNQGFCTKCGSIIPSSNKISSLKIEENEDTAPIRQHSKPMLSEGIISPQKVFLDLYSKRYLIDGIISIAVAVISLFFGVIIIIFSILMEIYSPLPYGQFLIRTIILIILNVLYATGLTFAIASRLNGKKLISNDLKNGPKKIKSVLWIIGLIINSFALIAFFIILIISILSYTSILY
ncbi:MAG: hypothetical protein ACFFBH_15120 [Promethearchaeota archaeon]